MTILAVTRTLTFVNSLTTNVLKKKRLIFVLAILATLGRLYATRRPPVRRPIPPKSALPVLLRPPGRLSKTRNPDYLRRLALANCTGAPETHIPKKTRLISQLEPQKSPLTPSTHTRELSKRGYRPTYRDKKAKMPCGALSPSGKGAFSSSKKPSYR